MRKDNKFNRLTWQRKELKGKRHPVPYKTQIREMYKEHEDAILVGEVLPETEMRVVNSQEENEAIMNAIDDLENNRSKYEHIPGWGCAVKVNGYIFDVDGLCWYVYKPTDIGIDPQYKGEPLVKVVPTTARINAIPAILNAQPWTYL